MQSWETLKPDQTLLLDRHFTPGRQGHKPEFAIIHHNAGNLSIEDIYRTWQTRKASAHYQVDINGKIGQLVLDRDTAWGASNHYANVRGLQIEHANNAMAPHWTISAATLDNGAHLVAAMCKFFQWGAPVWEKNVFPHQYFASTACPGALAGSQRDEYMARARHYYERKDPQQMDLNTVMPSLVPGSQFKDKLGNFIRHADRNSYDAARHARMILDRQDSIMAQNERIITLLEGQK